MKFVVSAVLIASLVIAPSASATLVGDTTETVRSTVKSVQDALQGPLVPNAAPPVTPPPAPVAAPDPVKATPTPDRPQPSSSAGSRSAGSDPGASAANGVTAAANAGRGIVRSVTGTAAGTAGHAPVVAGEDDGGSVPAGAPGSSSKPDDGVGATAADSRATATVSSVPDSSPRRADRASDISSSAALSLAASEVVALQRWIARIWPGVPLIGGDAGGSAAARALESVLLNPVATADRLLLAVTSAATAVGDSPHATHSPAANGRYTDLLGVMTTDWRKILYLIAIPVLLALLAFAVWRDFRHALRPRVR